MGLWERKNVVSMRSSYRRNEEFGVVALGEVVDGFVGEAILDFESSGSVEDGRILAAARRLELSETFPEERESGLDSVLRLGRVFST